jgi:predicted O-methyltransferase YrrM
MNNLLFLINFLIFAIKHPKIGKQILEAKSQSQEDSKILPFNYSEKNLSLNQLLNFFFPDHSNIIEDLTKQTNELQNHADKFFNKLKSETYPSKKKPYPLTYTLDNQSGLFLYILCKIVKPKTVVETGVAYGLSSMYILQALFENKKGTLYSIDSIFSPWQSKKMIGSAIPIHLCDNWKFIFGSSSDKLKDTLDSLDSLDIFFHDSLHTYKNMKFEFETAWPLLNKNGFLVSDDISGNNAFYDFYSKMNLESFVLPQNEKSFLGIIKKL